MQPVIFLRTEDMGNLLRNRGGSKPLESKAQVPVTFSCLGLSTEWNLAASPLLFYWNSQVSGGSPELRGHSVPISYSLKLNQELRFGLKILLCRNPRDLPPRTMSSGAVSRCLLESNTRNVAIKLMKSGLCLHQPEDAKSRPGLQPQLAFTRRTR